MPIYTDNYPLAGQTILVTRAISSSSQFRKMLEEKGATVFELPALEITPPSSWDDLDGAIAHINNFEWIILTSANGVNYFWQRLEKAGKNQTDLKGIKIAVVGKKTAQVLREYNLQADFIPPDFIADSMAENFPESLGDKRILFPRVETGGREILVQELTQKGALITEVAAYQSGCPKEMDKSILHALEERIIDIITFASSKTVRNFYTMVNTHFPHDTLSLFNHSAIASIGPQTSATCQEILGRVDIEAQEYTLDGLVKAIVEKVKVS
ncbi:Uroporphyrinogen-III synthase [Cyanobacterium stanieri PCC 7202]|uniref:Uroporphyrinogen-III synthase n=1 Tax=Cyanobacterium stanieri (strain ATCC 29140 / PCC 7202) TaxID=292563 RepID=K9YNV6_CYASC|nr:Uroporphyrinogen-III synthase [Cyanobacterium stanieri PCC 7202]